VSEPTDVVERLAREAAELHDSDVGELWKHPRFRRWVMHLLDAPERCYVQGPVKAPTDRDTMWLEGRRSIGHDVLLEVYRVCPELYVRGLSDALEQRDQDRTIIANAAAEAAKDNANG
jgi:hypothetical protein